MSTLGSVESLSSKSKKKDKENKGTKFNIRQTTNKWKVEYNKVGQLKKKRGNIHYTGTKLTSPAYACCNSITPAEAVEVFPSSC